MGASVSKNATKIVLNAVAKVSSEIIQTAGLSVDQNELVYVRDVKGDVKIEGNVFSQRASLNMNALFEALSTNESQQKLAVELSQSAKALTSGLNIGQYASAENDVDTMVSAAVDIISKIQESCTATTTQKQSIIVEHVRGDVTIRNNLFSQVSDIFAKCIESSVNKSTTFQSVAEKLQQQSDATSKGLSEWGIVAIIALIIGVPAIGTVVVGKEFMKNIFPLMILAGTVMTIVYYVMQTQTMKIKMYSQMIENTSNCAAQPTSQTASENYNTADDAAKYCNQQSSCMAFDWKKSNVDREGGRTNLSRPQSKFYTSVTSGCRDQIKVDNMNLLRNPFMRHGNDAPQIEPGDKKGDVYIDKTNTDWYQLNETWEKKGTIISDRTTIRSVNVMNAVPNEDTPGALDKAIIYYSSGDPGSFYVYRWEASTGWSRSPRVRGPDFYAYETPNSANASGVKETERKTWLLYGGIALAVFGLLGTVTSRNKKEV